MVKTLATFAEDQSLIPSIHIRWVTTASNVISRGSNVSGFLGLLHTLTHTHSTHTYTEFKSFFNY